MKLDTAVLVAYLAYFCILSFAAGTCDDDVATGLVLAVVSLHFVLGGAVAFKEGAGGAAAERYCQAPPYGAVASIAELALLGGFVAAVLALTDGSRDSFWVAWSLAFVGNVGCVAERLHRARPARVVDAMVM